MNRRSTYRVGLVAAITAAGAIAAAGTAFGTAGLGVRATPAVTGTADEKVRTRGNQPYDVVMHTVTFAPGGHSGWHTHPGQAIVLVSAGTLSVYDAETCSAEVFEAGDVFIDSGYGDVHLARNNGPVDAVVQVTYLDVPVGKPFRLDAADPGTCPS